MSRSHENGSMGEKVVLLFSLSGIKGLCPRRLKNGNPWLSGLTGGKCCNYHSIHLLGPSCRDVEVKFGVGHERKPEKAAQGWSNRNAAFGGSLVQWMGESIVRDKGEIS